MRRKESSVICTTQESIKHLRPCPYLYKIRPKIKYLTSPTIPYLYKIRPKIKYLHQRPWLIYRSKIKYLSPPSMAYIYKIRPKLKYLTPESSNAFKQPCSWLTLHLTPTFLANLVIFFCKFSDVLYARDPALHTFAA